MGRVNPRRAVWLPKNGNVAKSNVYGRWNLDNINSLIPGTSVSPHLPIVPTILSAHLLCAGLYLTHAPSLSAQRPAWPANLKQNVHQQGQPPEPPNASHKYPQ